MDIGWGKSITEALNHYDLPDDFPLIRNTSKRQWQRLVSQKTEAMNHKRLYDDCHKTENNAQTPKTKTAHIIPEISTDTYTRKPQDIIVKCNKYESKTLIIARFGMLECGRNYKGNKPEICSQCTVIDDEDHRLNHCDKFRDINFCNHTEKVDFKKIYSNDIDTVREVLPMIQKVWNTKTAHGTMAT